jgi:hypothetical protein
MKLSILWTIARGAVVAGTLGAAALSGALADHRNDGPRVHEPGRTMHGPPDHAYGEDFGRGHGRRHDCQAERWDPEQRYFPGQAVWRKGRLYVARDVSRSVYNVNSPPEWTPNYWARARC